MQKTRHGRRSLSLPPSGVEALRCDRKGQLEQRVALGLPRVMLHALRHSHASALIASGLDVKSISRRLGHATPVVALTVYAHLFHKTDAAAATVIEAAMRTGPER